VSNAEGMMIERRSDDGHRDRGERVRGGRAAGDGDPRVEM